jgi:transcriptional regulator with XRE-family HTH domain
MGKGDPEGGRPAKTLTDEQRVQVEALAAYLSQDQIADYFGISRNTLIAIMDREPDVSERYKRGKAKAVGTIASSLIQKARDGDTACMIFYLKTQAKWRETDRLEHVGVEGSPILHKVERVIIDPKEPE